MTELWWTVLAGCALAFATKLAGHVVPDRALANPRVRRITRLLPVALLTSLVVVQAFGTPGPSLGIDVRAIAVGAAVLALVLRAPFIVVVILAAGVAAGLRMVGLA